MKSVSCKLVSRKVHRRTVLSISCKVTYTGAARDMVVRMALSRGRVVYALGHAATRGHSTSVRMRELRRIGSGRYTLTLVMQRHGKALTIARPVRVR